MIENELLAYIENSLKSQFERRMVLRCKDNSNIVVYEHKGSGNKMLVRHSKVRNDKVYRALKGKHFEHLPAIYEVCVANGSVIVFEEYIEGKTLLDILNNGPLKKQFACDYAKQLCLALKELHSIGIIHRDIKPSNIIIKPDGTVILADFSIARMISSLQDRDTQTLGTAGYAAPEQFGISQSGNATDIYALGVLLNIMLTSVHPSIETANGRLGRIIKKATAIQISKRYQSAEKMYKALKKTGI